MRTLVRRRAAALRLRQTDHFNDQNNHVDTYVPGSYANRSSEESPLESQLLAGYLSETGPPLRRWPSTPVSRNGFVSSMKSDRILTSTTQVRARQRIVETKTQTVRCENKTRLISSRESRSAFPQRENKKTGEMTKNRLYSTGYSHSRRPQLDSRPATAAPIIEQNIITDDSKTSTETPTNRPKSTPYNNERHGRDLSSQRLPGSLLVGSKRPRLRTWAATANKNIAESGKQALKTMTKNDAGIDEEALGGQVQYLNEHVVKVRHGEISK